MKKFLLTFVLAVGSILLFQSCREDGDHSNLSENGLLIEQTPSAEIIVSNVYNRRSMTPPYYSAFFNTVVKNMKLTPVENNTITKIEYKGSFAYTFRDRKPESTTKIHEFYFVDDFTQNPMTKVNFENFHHVMNQELHNDMSVSNSFTFSNPKMKVIIHLSKGNTITKEFEPTIRVNN